MQTIAKGGNALVLLPTSGGKSSYYQLSNLLRPGVGTVVSPLTALMKGQVDTLSQLGVRAVHLNATLSPAAARTVQEQWDIPLKSSPIPDAEALHILRVALVTAPALTVGQGLQNTSGAVVTLRGALGTALTGVGRGLGEFTRGNDDPYGAEHRKKQPTMAGAG